ncbi:protein brambleberry-like [Saccoglossus kowalevskii]|uniref:Protein brambleberry-like n=1 Tax=Saccoglossus kowalevskii TaxID=10224 RepID=A0ABM0MI75_SACKO|nr:PREDICTED: protein brambleberry-like [Saccoglossus kowalevskii]
MQFFNIIMANVRFLSLFILVLLCRLSESFLFWASDTDEKETKVPKAYPVKGHAPFEMKTDDEKFSAVALQYLSELSELDLCHHEVIAELKDACNDITEEELAKLGVALLNCQSQAEGRTTYTCTEDMSIGDCTSSMDSNTWNAYHIISNRARAVCYAVRQQHFQYKTQNAVNQLALTAEGQLHLMKHLHENHENLIESTDKVINTMTTGQRELIGKQERLKASQVQMQSHIVDNLRILTEEKSLIAAGHKEFAERTEYLRELLETTSNELISQGSDAKENHAQLLEDLSVIRDRAGEIWTKIEGSSQNIMDYHDESRQYYENTLENLRKMNETANHVLVFLSNMQSGIDKKLSWISSVLGGTGDNVAVLMTCILHLLYFLLITFVMTLLKTPTFSRFILLLIIPLNAASQIRHKTSLGYMTLTWFIAICVLVNWLYLLLWSALRGKPTPVRSQGPDSPCSCGFQSPYKSIASPLSSPYVTNLTPLPSGVKKAVSDEVNHLMKVILDGWSQDNLPKKTKKAAILDNCHSESKLFDESELNNSIVSNMSDITINKILESTALNATLQETIGHHYDSVFVSTLSPVTPSNSCQATPHSNDTPMPTSDDDVFPPTPGIARKHLGKLLNEVTGSPRRRTKSCTPQKNNANTSTTLSAGGTPRRPCLGITKTGLPCKRSSIKNQDYCTTHLPH